jgi:hypothetical protein
LARIAVAKKRFGEGSRKDANLDSRHKTTAFDFPERRLWKSLAPEALPSGDGGSVSPDESR